MGILNFIKRTDINSGVDEYKSTKDAILLDVRTPEEVKEESIEGSINIPLDKIMLIEDKIPDKATPIFVHCRSGARSGQAVSYLKQIGYKNAINIGGIINYLGKKERG